MKGLLTIVIALIPFNCCKAQQDSTLLDKVVPVNEVYIKHLYNAKTKTFNLSYNYSNLWDLDGDNKKDSLYFIGNAGAHTYFYLSILLSSDGIVRDFPSVQLDMPYFASKEALEKHGKSAAVQFVVDDFDNDAVADIYLNFDNPFATIPKAWQQKGVNTKYVLLFFKRNKIKVSNY